MGTIDVQVTRVETLGAAERDAWRAFAAAHPRAAHPYFDLRYAEAVAAVAPDARVAVARRDDAIVALLPFQRRGGVLQPIGAPLTDYHAILAAPGERVDLPTLVETVGGRVFRFNGLLDDDPDPRWTRRTAMRADLSAGWDGWLAERQKRKPGVFKNLRRAERALERDLGPATFLLDDPDPAALEHVLKSKRAQLARTGWPDIFACGWTEALLRRLWEERTPDFGVKVATLRVGGRIVSAEIGLHGAGVRHLWFPVYDPSLGRYAPGMLMTLKTLQACAEAGVTRVDFGSGPEGYKSAFADPAETVFEGSVAARPWRAAASRLIDAAVAADPHRLGRLRTAFNRRLDVATACEPDMGRRVGILARLKLGAARASASVFSFVPLGLCL